MSRDKWKHRVRQQFGRATNLSCDFHVALEDTLYHDCETRYSNRCTFNLTTCEVLRHEAAFLLHLSGIVLNTYFMNTCVILHYEHKNDWNMFVFADSVIFILFSEFIMSKSWIIMLQKNNMVKDMINYKTWRHDYYQTSKSYSPAARSSIKMSYNYCDVIFRFKI